MDEVSVTVFGAARCCSVNCRGDLDGAPSEVDCAIAPGLHRLPPTFVCLDGHPAPREFASYDSGGLWRFMHHRTLLDHRDNVGRV